MNGICIKTTIYAICEDDSKKLVGTYIYQSSCNHLYMFSNFPGMDGSYNSFIKNQYDNNLVISAPNFHDMQNYLRGKKTNIMDKIINPLKLQKKIKYFHIINIYNSFVNKHNHIKYINEICK